MYRGEEDALAFRQLVPGFDVVALLGVPGRQLGARRQEPEVDLAPVTGLSDPVPPEIEHPPVALHVDRLGLQWGMHRTVGEVEQERLCRVSGLGRADHVDRMVGEVVGEVVAVGVAVDLHGVVVLHQAVGLVEVGEGVEEAVEAVEPPLQRPRVPRARFGHVGVLGEMPLAHREGRPSRVAERLGGGGDVGGQFGGVTGKARIGVGDVPDAGPMGIDAGEQRGAGR